MTWQQRYLQHFYTGRANFVNGTHEFHQLVMSTAGTGGRLLEVGAGPTNETSEFLSGMARVYGLDTDEAVLANTALTSAAVLDSSRYPFEDGYFDACVSNWVVEHVADPVVHLREIYRVLRPDGAYVFRTPNRWHYATLLSAISPQWFHERIVNRLDALPPESHGPYPTFYRLNTRSAVKNAAREVGFHPELVRFIEKEPYYGFASRAMFLAFTGYERLVNSTDLLAGLRQTILVVLRRPNG